MRETPEDLKELQSLLDSSLSRSTSHLRSIINERTLTAEQLTQVLTGMCTLALSTVTAKGEPRISGVDGHFLHGKWHFGTAPSAAKARHLAARPAASVAHMRGEDLGVFTHGTVEILNPQDGEAGRGLAGPARLLEGLLRRRRLRLGQRRGLLPATPALDDRLRPRRRQAHRQVTPGQLFPWSRLTESNRRPTHYEIKMGDPATCACALLPAETALGISHHSPTARRPHAD